MLKIPTQKIIYARDVTQVSSRGVVFLCFGQMEFKVHLNKREYQANDNMKYRLKPVFACKQKVNLINCIHNSTKFISYSFRELIWGISGK
jgi:hypothetical protein